MLVGMRAPALRRHGPLVFEKEFGLLVDMSGDPEKTETPWTRPVRRYEIGKTDSELPLTERTPVLKIGAGPS
jgi:hypothetical protein